ncbi:hypothetical protein KUTeg_022882 [Tegillarca granosa]|uniref:Uncharacterized protein n=1 Tax=Tegillarca granosa TaxID=220873 RepID=A0ABQ9E0P4_TEGGR|nr:hypothetical protein KUTeg_022882 [Tegillarca granosa]
MVPKLSAFYHKALCFNTLGGIRELGILALTQLHQQYQYKVTQSYCKRESEVTTTVKQDNRHQSVKHFDSRVNPSPFSSTLKAEHKDSASKAKQIFPPINHVLHHVNPKVAIKTNKKKQVHLHQIVAVHNSAQQTLGHARSKKITCHNFNATLCMSFSAMIRYSGTVLDVTSGKDVDDDAVYDILYDGDDEAYTVDHLVHDYHSNLLIQIPEKFCKRNLTLETWKLVCSFKPFQLGISSLNFIIVLFATHSCIVHILVNVLKYGRRHEKTTGKQVVVENGDKIQRGIYKDMQNKCLPNAI